MVDMSKEISVKQVILKKARKALYKNVTNQSYFDMIPLDQIKEAIRPLGFTLVMEDGDEWCGFFCGSSGHTQIRLTYNGELVGNSVLILNWYGREVTGLAHKIEINAYIS